MKLDGFNLDDLDLKLDDLDDLDDLDLELDDLDDLDELIQEFNESLKDLSFDL